MDCYSCGGDRFVKQKSFSRQLTARALSLAETPPARARAPCRSPWDCSRAAAAAAGTSEKSPERHTQCTHREGHNCSSASSSQSVEFLNYFYYSISTHTPPYLGLFECLLHQTGPLLVFLPYSTYSVSYSSSSGGVHICLFTTFEPLNNICNIQQCQVVCTMHICCLTIFEPLNQQLQNFKRFSQL